MANMYGTHPSLVPGLASSDTAEVSTLLNQLIRHKSSSSCMSSKTKTLSPPWLSPPVRVVGTAGFLHLDSDDPFENPHRFAQLELGTDSGSHYPLKLGKSLAAGSSTTFNFSDPYDYIPIPAQAHVEEATENQLLSNAVKDSDANSSLKQNRTSPDCDFISPLEKNTEVSELPSKPVSPRTSSKRSRAAEVHNLSEKRRRSRINEKMKALQNLIPNSNKTDKASMLDEAIEYLKQLQLQVQMLMMRNGLSLHPMCLPGALPPTVLPQSELNFDQSHEFQNSSSGVASSVNAEGLVQSAFSLPKYSTISNPSVFQPSVDAHFGHYNRSTSSKDEPGDSKAQLLLDTTKIGKTSSSDVS
ncbi:hypothetical protein L6164_024645 [Bauhinia variegata]|uniref:Uncharacterized protein n=1 Tax=Bauhinia variegata TaxID=167791 RepID=A0ACB9LYA4_BAUVA|nr:hypothetical protein L6164_024645 [Bauhinia variegata]